MASGDDLVTFPASNGYGDFNNTQAAPAIRNQHFVASFDDTQDEYWIFEGIMPSWYSGGNIHCGLHWLGATATTGDVIWYVAFERILAGTTDIDSDSWDTEQGGVVDPTDTTSGETAQLTFLLSNGLIDDIAAGDAFRLRLRRNSVHADDDMVGDAQILFVEILEA